MGHIGIVGVDKKAEELYQLKLGGSGAEDDAVGQALGPALLYEKVAEGVDNVVEVYVGYLRRKSNYPGLEAMIVTVRGAGYRLTNP